MCKNFNNNYFDYAEYLKMFDVISADADMAEAVDDAVTQCRNYVNVVDMTEQQIMLASVRFDGEELKEMITRYDIQRHNAHNTAVASANMLNRISKLYGFDTIYKGGEDRLEVADFCLEVVTTIFNNRH